ncbi:DUF1684 domain-containing protein [Neolewinella antarctica]|uniref:Uncharacterized protein (DUF1684 family) n=1 Tax=Neolewinella antarctica TaxID=442734 RepID=A0ABX0XH13_9BACT|nr:DUF1684 domain-containing protein [Neolewinella antarctica]NJC28492.1 uncharacterized protein (DUF1684 family) [Neolewinella antarctica]
MKQTLLFVLAILLSPLTGSAQESKIPDEMATLLDLLYSTEDLNVRMQGAIGNNATITKLETNQQFVKAINEALQRDIMAEYSQSAYASLSELSPTEVDSLTTVLQSPYGDVIRKAFLLDNAVMDTQFDAYLNGAVWRARREVQKSDSLLYFRELGVDLSQYMDGNYVSSDPILDTVWITRKGNAQTEYARKDSVAFDVAWVNNSKYVITDKNYGLTYEPGLQLFANVYEVDGNVFKYIVRMPNGDYDKVELVRDEPVPGDVDAQLFQQRLTAQYASPEDSPLDEAKRALLAERGGHQFFPVAEKYRVLADLEVFENPATISLPTSAGTETAYRVYGKASFIIDGKPISLSVYQAAAPLADPEYANHLFLPFRDATSGEETYGGGKYVDLRIPANGANKILIDFNKSYQPYCAYTDGYFCPVPPEENTVRVRIEAGVKHVELGE